MKNQIIRSLVLFMLYVSAIQTVSAQTTFTESQHDSLQCVKEEGETHCDVNTKGSFSVASKIPLDALRARGINLATLTENTPISIEIGQYSFIGALNEADSHKLTKNLVEAKWSESTEPCLEGECKQSKPIVYTDINLSSNTTDLTLKVSGKSVSADDQYGSSVFSDLCDVRDDGDALDETMTLKIGKTAFNIPLNGVCNVKSKTAENNDQDFNLTSISIEATDISDKATDVALLSP